MTRQERARRLARQVVLVGLFAFGCLLLNPNLAAAQHAGERTPAATTPSPSATETVSPEPSATASKAPATPSPTGEAPPTHTDDPAATQSETSPAPTTTPRQISPTPDPVTTPTPDPVTTPTPDPASTPSPTSTGTPAASATLAPPRPTPLEKGAVLINEVAWAGTLASANDEWIELLNTTGEAVDLSGWTLTDDGDLHVSLAGIIAPYSFFLLERTDDSTVADIDADLIYTGSLKNGGETLRLIGPSGALIDSANMSGGGWPAGDAPSRASMERRGGEDHPGNWGTFTGWGGRGHDAAGGPIEGTPRSLNSLDIHTPTPPTPEGSATPTATQTTPPSTPIAEGAVLINEVAWAGTLASASDEWIELLNTTGEAVDLSGWTLTDDGDLHVSLAGIIAPYSFFLLERTDDSTVADIDADLIYTGSLKNGGETLRLIGPSGALIDSANMSGGGWPAGDAPSRASMERRGGEDHPGNWGTFTGYHGAGHDAAGSPIMGTPRSANSLLFPTPAPTWIPGRVRINEVLIRPHYDWEGSGGASTDDEFIELYNIGPGSVDLSGWVLDDIADGGSRPYALPGLVIGPGEWLPFFHSETRLALNDAGDSVRLLAPDGRIVDQVSYLRVRAYNLSFGRLPDGNRHLYYGLWPTPGKPNERFDELPADAALALKRYCAASTHPRLLVPRLGRLPAFAAWASDMGHVFCRENLPAAPPNPASLSARPPTDPEGVAEAIGRPPKR